VAPMVLAQILGSMMESNFRRSLAMSQGDFLIFFTRPITVVILIETIFLLNTALQRAISEGTAHTLARYLPATTAVAGKTGTTDNLRDSWFAGFTGDRLAVVWVGRDDNTPAGVTGSSGALPVWGEIMRALHPQTLALQQPPGIEWAKIDKQTLAAPGLFGADSTLLPFLAGTGPDRETILPSLDTEKIEKKAKGVLHTVRGWFE